MLPNGLRSRIFRLLLISMLACPAAAQSVAGVISGSVRDPELGDVVFSSVAPGTYRLGVQSPDFKTLTQFSALDTAARFDANGNQVNADPAAFTRARKPRIMQFALRATF